MRPTVTNKARNFTRGTDEWFEAFGEDLASLDAALQWEIDHPTPADLVYRARDRSKDKI